MLSHFITLITGQTPEQRAEAEKLARKEKLEKKEKLAKAKEALKYKVKSHPKFGFCAMRDTSPLGPEYGQWWSPIRDDTTTGAHGDSYLKDLHRDNYWVKTLEEAQDRVERHKTQNNTRVVSLPGLPYNYRIREHDNFGFCPMVNESPGPEYGQWWSPIRDDTTTGAHGDAYLSKIQRDTYWVETLEEAKDRIERHMLNNNTQDILM